MSVNGKWDVSTNQNNSTWTITNTWTQAESLFNGSTDFAIKKIDEKGNPLAGVKFMVNDEEYITDENGKIVIEIPVNLLVSSETKNYKITEIATKDGYKLDSDEAYLEVLIESGLVSVDKAALVNTYNKSFTFTASGNENYAWNKEEIMFILKNNRIPNPCKLGGCGSSDEGKPKTPNTGKATAENTATASTSVVGVMLGGMVLLLIFGLVQKNKKEI